MEKKKRHADQLKSRQNDNVAISDTPQDDRELPTGHIFYRNLIGTPTASQLPVSAPQPLLHMHLHKPHHVVLRHHLSLSLGSLPPHLH